MKLLLPRHEIFRIDGDARGLTVRCSQGTLWLTQPGDNRDYILNPDDGFTVSHKGCVAITALEDAYFDVTPLKNAGKASLFNLSLASKMPLFPIRRFVKGELPHSACVSTGVGRA